jgi:hypothetical protein
MRFFEIESVNDIGSATEKEIFHKNYNTPFIPPIGSTIFVNDIEYIVIDVTYSYDEYENDIGIEIFVKRTTIE